MSEFKGPSSSGLIKKAGESSRRKDEEEEQEKEKEEEEEEEEKEEEEEEEEGKENDSKIQKEEQCVDITPCVGASNSLKPVNLPVQACGAGQARISDMKKGKHEQSVLGFAEPNK